jgi:hypothetical protein
MVKPPDMQPAWQKYYNYIVLLASRGIGSVIITSLFLIKKYFLPPDEFGSLGHAFATAMFVVSPFASPVVMLISRRIIQTRDLGRDKDIILGWCILSFLGAAFVSIMSIISPRGISDLVFMISIISFILVTVLNSQYIIWLNESDQTKRSLIYIGIFMIAIPLSVVVREITGIGQRDRAFSVETLLLCIPVLFDIIRTKTKERFHVRDLYDFSMTNYTKYFAIVLFYNGILWVDWNLGRDLLPEPVYLEWANERIILERILLPVLNIIQVTMIWHLLRSATGKQRIDTEPLTARSIKIFQAILIVFAITAILARLFDTKIPILTFVPFIIGYLAFGLTSIFLEFYQAKYSIWYLAITLTLITISRFVIIIVSLKLSGTEDYAIAWALTSILILSFVFQKSRDQIKVGKSL